MPRSPADPPPSAIPLSPLARRFVLHWGEMGSRWGVNRTVAQVHALLYFIGRPAHAEEIATTLDVARSNVSNSIRELQSWQLVRVVHRMDDRRDHFETSDDVWELFRTIVAERKRREFDPTMTMLRDCIDDPAIDDEDADARKRIAETLALMEALSAWGDEMLRLDPATLTKIMKLGARVQGLVRGGKAARDEAGRMNASVAWPLTIYFDAACPLCAREMRMLRERDAARRLVLVDCSRGPLDDACVAAGLTRDALLAAIHARDAAGRWWLGVDVFAAAYDAAGLRIVARLLASRRLRPLLRRVYPWVARHRAVLARLGLRHVFAAVPRRGPACACRPDETR